MGKLLNINETNKDAVLIKEIQERLLIEFPKEKLIGVEFGVAYGGGIESICKTWKDRGFVFGLDTFNGHPKHLDDNPNSTNAGCMEGWYLNYGKEKLSYEYITSVLWEEYSNFQLLQGEIHKHSLDHVFNIHYALLDLDILNSMKIAYSLIENKMVKGGYICVHDVIPKDHLEDIYNWWHNNIMVSNKYQEIMKGTYLGVYKVL